MIYFRCYIEDYDDATIGLTVTEDGVFGRLLRCYYRTEKPIPLGREAIMARATNAAERKAVQHVLARFFVKQADGWHNARADHEITVANQARANGANGGRPKGTGSETGSITGSDESGYQKRPEKETGSGQPYKPTSTKSPKTTPIPTEPTNLPTKDLSRGASPPAGAKTSAAWEGYSEAFLQRYGVTPRRNARVNASLAKLVDCVGVAEAPHVAAFYVRHNRGAYVVAKHPVTLLARDGEGLWAEWATNRQVSETEARQADRTMATGNAFAPLIAAAKASEAA